MAEQALGLTLNAVPVAIKHHDKVWDPVHHRWKKIRGQLPKEDEDIYDRRIMEEKGLVLRRRRDVAPDEEIVEVVRHKGEVLPRRPGQRRRASSLNNERALVGAGAGAGAGALAHHRDRRDSYYDSEGSVPPRSRVRAKSSTGQSRKKRGSSSDSSTSSSSSLVSSTEEEKICKKIQRKKWITAALASVATIHAASKVYSSIEAHDKRMEKVREGTLSPEQAHKQQRAARWQDAAAIGIAALGIKGAVSEWNEVSEEHAEHKRLLLEKEEHHKKRLEQERRRRARERDGYYKGRDGHWYYAGPARRSTSSSRGDRARARYPDSEPGRDSGRNRRRTEDDSDDSRDRSRRAVSRRRADDY
ncbi:hypothetical protein ABEF95_011270 [Exophiala dermatitidis]